MADRCDFRPGDIIDSQYRVERVLGEGSFGKVFSVIASDGGRQALKLLKLWEVHPDIREGLVHRFDMEFETSRIESKYLVHSFYHGYVQGNPYMVMEFCPGGDLFSHMTRGDLDLSRVATHTLLGMRDLHVRGKVHRDLKPENVLQKADGCFALTDFGICGDRNKRMTERNIMGRPSQIFGTYAYMPPEQLLQHRDATVLPTTDIFSFGVMMYQMLTQGQLPFGPLDGEGDLPSYIRRGKAGEWDQEPIRYIDNGVWLGLIEGCLRPDFRQRLQNCDEVLAYVPGQGEGFQKDVGEQNGVTPDYQTFGVNGILLRVMQGEEFGMVYYLDNLLQGNCSVLRVGRRDYSVKNDIAIREEDSCYVSRYHCTLELDYDRGCWVIRDGQWRMPTATVGVGSWHRSTNGTYVNSQEVNEVGIPIKPGDIISIGDVKLRAEAY